MKSNGQCVVVKTLKESRDGSCLASSLQVEVVVVVCPVIWAVTTNRYHHSEMEQVYTMLNVPVCYTLRCAL